MAIAVFPVLYAYQPSVLRYLHDSLGGGFLQPRRTGDEDRATGNLAVLDHLQDDGGSLASLLLAHETLRCSPRLKSRGIDAETANVGVRGDEVQTAKVLGFGHGHDGLTRS